LVEQIAAVLKQAEMGIPVTELIRQVGISEQAFSRWKKHYTTREVDQVRQRKQLQEENARLRRLGAKIEGGVSKATRLFCRAMPCNGRAGE